MAVVSDLFTDARVQREAEALADCGHEVRVIGFDYRRSRATSELRNGVEYQLFPFPSRDRPRWRRVLGFAVFWMRAAKAILSSPADAIHAHNLHLAVPCWLAARRWRAELVYDAHEVVDRMLSGLGRQIAVPYERAVYRRADAVITTNQSRARHLEGLHGPPTPIVLGNYPNPPDELRPVDLRGQLGIPVNARILIYQGGFYVHARCFDRVAVALASLPEWHFVLVGFGSSQTAELLRRQLQDAGLDGRAHILPPVPAGELLHITAGADAGVIPLLPVVGNELGDTNKLFEYLVAGKPAVGNDFPEIRMPILDNPLGRVGAVFDADDPASIVSALQDVDVHLDEYSRRAGEVGRRWYCWDIERGKLVELYDRLEHAHFRRSSDLGVQA